MCQPALLTKKIVHVLSPPSHGFAVIQLEIELGRRQKVASQTRAIDVIEKSVLPSKATAKPMGLEYSLH